MEDILRLCNQIRETAFALHNFHRHGHLEKVYENALAHRLHKLGLSIKQQHPIPFYDEDGTVLVNYCADLFVEGRLIVEIKATRCLADEHIAQLFGYLRASPVEHGLLLNFGAPKFQIRKYILSAPVTQGGLF